MSVDPNHKMKALLIEKCQNDIKERLNCEFEKG